MMHLKQLAFVPAFALMACCLCPPALFAEAPAPLSDAEFLKLCYRGTPEEVMHALKNGANPNAKDHKGWTALRGAVGYAIPRDLGVVKALLEAGADVNAKDKEDGETALMRAVIEDEERLEIIKILLAAGADVNAKDNLGASVLMWAARFAANPEEVKILLAAGADVNAQSEYHGGTALMFAAGYNIHSNPEIIKTLLAAGGEVNVKDDRGLTALMYAARMNNVQAVRVLLEAGAAANAKDKEGRDALWYVDHADQVFPQEDKRPAVQPAIIQLLEEAMKNAKAR